MDKSLIFISPAEFVYRTRRKTKHETPYVPLSPALLLSVRALASHSDLLRGSSRLPALSRVGCCASLKPADKRRFSLCSEGFTDGVAFALVDPTQYEVGT